MHCGCKIFKVGVKLLKFSKLQAGQYKTWTLDYWACFKAKSVELRTYSPPLLGCTFVEQGGIRVFSGATHSSFF